MRAILFGCLAVLVAGDAVATGAPRKDTRPSIALLSVAKGAGFSDEQLGTIEDVLLSAIERTNRFRVIGRSDVNALLTLDAKRQAAGCDDSDCLTQIAGALGVEYVATASAGRLGDVTVLVLKVINVRTAVVLVHGRETVHSDGALVASADRLAEEAALAVPLEEAPMPLRNKLAWTTTALGAAALVAACILGATVRLDTSSLQTPTPNRTLAREQQTQQSINGRVLPADVLFGVGGALSLTGVGLVVEFR